MRRIEKGELPRPVKDGRDYKITAQWLDAAMAKREVELIEQAHLEKLRKRSALMLERAEAAANED